jgi:hypothetical protein
MFLLSALPLAGFFSPFISYFESYYHRDVFLTTHPDIPVFLLQETQFSSSEA